MIANAGTRLLPGLSYTFTGSPPPQAGLSLDADSPQPVTLVPFEEFAAADYLPEAVAFRLRPGGRSLVLEPGGGLGVLQALAAASQLSQQSVTVVISNPLVRAAVGQAAPSADVYADLRVRTVIESPRVYLRRVGPAYDVVFLPLTDAYRPISSGAYGLGETYGLTVEAFADALARLAPDGVLVATRWLQTPPSESIRLVATLIEALEERGIAHPGETLVAYRGIQTITVLVQPDGWSADELAAVREFTAARRYDLVWAPDVRDDEVNRFNRLPEPADYQAVRALLAAPDRAGFYADYPFDITPAEDDHPFFYHFFKWRQTPGSPGNVGPHLAAVRRQRLPDPVGAAGAGAGIVGGADPGAAGPASRHAAGGPESGGVARPRFRLLRPARHRVSLCRDPIDPALDPAARPRHLRVRHGRAQPAAFLRSGQPADARRLAAAAGRVGSAGPDGAAYPTSGCAAGRCGAGLAAVARAAVAVIGLAPLGVLMGLPFPRGVAWLEDGAPRLIPWAWAVNGAASVVASVLAAILALSSGFTVVLLLGAGCYAVAGSCSPAVKRHLQEAFRVHRVNPRHRTAKRVS